MDETRRVVVLGTRFGPPTLEAEELAGLGVSLALGSGATAATLIDEAEGAVALLAGAPPRFTGEVLSQLPACHLIVRYGVGTETIDVEAATRLGILVANVPDYCTEEVATHTLTLILACGRRLLEAHASVAAGQWQFATLRPLFSTESQVLGLVGFGRIGQAVARKAQAFGFEVLVHDPYLSPEQAGRNGLQRVDLPTLLARADFVSLNAPLTPETRHLINAETLAQMKPTAFLVNTSRGGLVDEAALLDALNDGRPAGAALDVLETEPAPAAHPLLATGKVWVTPHMAWYTEQSTERMRRYGSREVARLLRGERPLNLVNPQALPGARARLADGPAAALSR